MPGQAANTCTPLINRLPFHFMVHIGVGTLLDRANSFIAVHRDRSVIPITLRVSKVSGLNEDSVFMGVMEVSCQRATTSAAFLHDSGAPAIRCRWPACPTSAV